MLDGAPGMGDEAQEMQHCAPGICNGAREMRRGERERPRRVDGMMVAERAKPDGRCQVARLMVGFTSCIALSALLACHPAWLRFAPAWVPLRRSDGM